MSRTRLPRNRTGPPCLDAIAPASRSLFHPAARALIPAGPSLDGAAESSGFFRRHRPARQQRIQRQLQPLRIDPGWILAVVDGSVIAEHAVLVHHVTLGSNRRAEMI